MPGQQIRRPQTVIATRIGFRRLGVSVAGKLFLVVDLVQAAKP